MGFIQNLKNRFTGIAKKHNSNSFMFGSNFSFGKYSESKSLNEGYNGNDDVYAMITKAARTTSTNIDWKLCELNADDELEEVTNSQLNDILNSPNKYQSLVDFREQAYTYLMSTGRSFIGGVVPIGFREYNSIHNLPSNLTTFKSGDLSNPYIDFKVDWNYQREWMAEDVLFTKYPNLTSGQNNYFDGQSPLLAGNSLLESSNHRNLAEATSLKNRGAAGILTNRGEDAVLPAERQAFQKQLDSQLGGSEKFNKIIQTGSNLDYIQLGLSPTDLKLIESDVMHRRRLANIYNFSSSLFNDPANKTFNNQREANKEAFLNVYIPMDNKFVANINSWLVSKFNAIENRNMILVNDYSNVDVLQEDREKNTKIKEVMSNQVFNILKDIAPTNPDGAVIMLVDILGFNIDKAEEMVRFSNNINVNE